MSAPQLSEMTCADAENEGRKSELLATVHSELLCQLCFAFGVPPSPIWRSVARRARAGRSAVFDEPGDLKKPLSQEGDRIASENLRAPKKRFKGKGKERKSARHSTTNGVVAVRDANSISKLTTG